MRKSQKETIVYEWITLEDTEPTAINKIASNEVKIYSVTDGIIIKGAPAGETIHTYTVSGMLVKKGDIMQRERQFIYWTFVLYEGFDLKTILN